VPASSIDKEYAMLGMNNSKMEAALLYGVVLLVAVFWFDVRTDSLGEARQIMVPYFPVFYFLVVVSGALLASYLSDVFLRDTSRWIMLLSAAFQPLAVLLVSSFVAAAGLGVALHLGLGPQPDEGSAAIWGVISLSLNALSVCILFVAVAWPVLLIGLPGATYLLWSRHGHTKGEE
jgi:hypothetical protein